MGVMLPGHDGNSRVGSQSIERGSSSSSLLSARPHAGPTVRDPFVVVEHRHLGVDPPMKFRDASDPIYSNPTVMRIPTEVGRRFRGKWAIGSEEVVLSFRQMWATPEE